MASTPEQRQLDERAAFSARFGLSRVHVLAAVAALVVAAVTASAVLAQLAGWKTSEHPATPGFLATALGAPQADAPLVREPDAGIRVTIDDRGFRLASERGALGLALEGVDGDWTRYQHGVARSTDLGVETITVDGARTEQSLVVTSRHGARTWRWQLDSDLDPRVTPEGWVGFFDGLRLTDLAIAPVAIYDAEGRDVTPDGATWSVVEHDSTHWLELALDDRGLTLPYVIDPIALRTAGAAVTSTGTTISPVIPATARVNDVLLLHVSVANGAAATQPTGWTAVVNSNVGNNNVSQAVFTRDAVVGDAGTTVNVTIPANVAAAYIEVYKGVDSTAAIQTVASTTGNSQSPTCPSLTTTVANQIAICSSAIRANVTYPAGPVNSFTLRNTGQNTIELAQYDRVMATAGATGTTTFTNLAGSNSRWVGHTLALTPDSNNPTHGTIALSGVIPSGVAYTNGTTIYYRGSTAGQFQIQDPASDTQSAVESVNYPLTTGAWTHANETVTTATTYTSSAYSYTAGAAAPSAGAADADRDGRLREHIDAGRAVRLRHDSAERRRADRQRHRRERGRDDELHDRHLRDDRDPHRLHGGAERVDGRARGVGAHARGRDAIGQQLLGLRRADDDHRQPEPDGARDGLLPLHADRNGQRRERGLGYDHREGRHLDAPSSRA